MGDYVAEVVPVRLASPFWTARLVSLRRHAAVKSSWSCWPNSACSVCTLFFESCGKLNLELCVYTVLLDLAFLGSYRVFRECDADIRQGEFTWPGFILELITKNKVRTSRTASDAASLPAVFEFPVQFYFHDKLRARSNLNLGIWGLVINRPCSNKVQVKKMKINEDVMTPKRFYKRF